MNQPFALLQLGLSLGVGAVFVASALPKLRHPRGFVLAVMEYRILPARLSRIVGRLIPPMELVAGLLLLTGTSVQIAALVLATLAVSFIAAVGTNLRRGRALDCNCFGEKAKRRIGWRVLVEEVALLAVCLVAAITGTPGAATGLAAWSIWRAPQLVGVAAPAGIWPALLSVGAAVFLALALDPAIRRRARQSFTRPGMRRLAASGSSPRA